jgi:nucleoside-diphosphate-sugar epimerase
MKKVLVTGSKGFIGSHLMRALGDRGVAYDIKEHSFMDINNAENLRATIVGVRPSVIVHLAALSNKEEVDHNPDLALRTNIIGTFNVLRLADRYNTRVILASSAATAEPELSLYGTSKDCMERLARMFTNVTIARFYNVYGPGSKSVVNLFFKSVKSGRIVKLNGNTKRDYIHVDDLVNSLLSLIDAKEPPELVEIGTGRVTSLHKLLSIIKKITGKEPKVKQLKSLKEIQYSQCNNRYGIYKTTLEQGIRGLI